MLATVDARYWQPWLPEDPPLVKLLFTSKARHNKVLISGPLTYTPPKVSIIIKLDTISCSIKLLHYTTYNISMFKLDNRII